MIKTDDKTTDIDELIAKAEDLAATDSTNGDDRHHMILVALLKLKKKRAFGTRFGDHSQPNK